MSDTPNDLSTAGAVAGQIAAAALSAANTPEPLNAMVDIETLGRRPFCPVLSIGACIVTMEPLDPAEAVANAIPDIFYQAITLESCLAVGLKPDASTMLWWLVGDKDQPDNSPTAEARVQTFADPHAVPLAIALDAFTTWINSRPLKLWGNSARFDLGILEAAYVACGKELPWEFFNERCYRTIKNLPEAREVKLQRYGLHHNALDDAISQALHLREINQRLHLQL